MGVVAALLLFTATRARAEEAPAPIPEKEKPRIELAAFPLLSGNRDIGFQFGAAAFLTRVAYEQKPYFWRGETALTASVKPNPSGTEEIAQQVYGVRFDYPHAFGSDLRITPATGYEHYVNAGFFGVGNASVAAPFNDGTFGRRYQAILDEVQARCEIRFPIVGPIDGLVGAQARRTNARAYPGSKLQADTSLAPSSEAHVFGLGPMSAVLPDIGLVYDTRDNEISPHSGGFDILGLRAGVGLSESRTRYVAASIVIRHYFPVVGPLVFATRFVGDFIVGDAPFFDQIRGITFSPVTMFGGAKGVRGIPDGRYAGNIKMFATAELRSLLTDFRFLKQRFRIGAQTFVDAGRVFSDFTPDPVLDGRKLDLKWGAGVGTYVIWGEGAIIRAEIAYSPDARAYTGSFPFGVYIVDSHSF